ncbi:ketopantoate reductase family protein [Hydrogenimonas sp.]
MTLGIVGAGGVGGFLAATLAEAGEEVLLLARGRHLEAIRKKGLCVKIRDKERCARPLAAENAADFGKTADAVLFCTKGYDLKEAAEASAAMIGPDTLLVPFGNGVGNAEILKTIYPDNPVANGAIYIVSHLEAPGVVKVAGKGALAVFGVDGEVPERVKRLGEAFEKAGIKTKVSGNITTEVWRKFLLIAALATLTSCYDMPMGAVLEKRRDELEAALGEIAAVGRAEGAALTEADIDNVFKQLAKVPYDSPTSMWLDFRAGRPTELEQLTGYVVRKADEHGIAVPVMRRCYETLLDRGQKTLYNM